MVVWQVQKCCPEAEPVIRDKLHVLGTLVLYQASHDHERNTVASFKLGRHPLAISTNM